MEKIDSWRGRSGAADRRGQRFHTGPIFRNYLICIFMNINKNLKNEGENHQLN